MPPADLLDLISTTTFGHAWGPAVATDIARTTSMATHNAAAESSKSSLSSSKDSHSNQLAELGKRLDKLSSVTAQVQALQQLVAQHASQLASSKILIEEHCEKISELQNTIK
jgi:F0F1-type ATP synthase delta subunit